MRQRPAGGARPFRPDPGICFACRRSSLWRFRGRPEMRKEAPMRARRTTVGLCILFGSLIGTALVLANRGKPIERLQAFAASLGTGRSGVIEITIDRWSTDQERE